MPQNRNVMQVEPGEVRAGSFVEWTWQDGTAQGQVESVHTEGPVNVPGADVTLDASEDNPTALVESWVEIGESGTYRRTGTMVGRRFASLRRIDPLPEGDSAAVAASVLQVEPGGGRLPDAYRPATAADVPDGQSCGNCAFFRAGDADTAAWCAYWDAAVAADHFCDAWQAEGEAVDGAESPADDAEGEDGPDGGETAAMAPESAGDALAYDDEEDRMAAGGASWRGVLAVEAVETGDGRMFTAGALRWDTPVPLRWAREDYGAHDGAVVVGRVLSMERDGDEIIGAGDFDTASDEGMEAWRQVAEGLTTGVSVDLDDVDLEVWVDDRAAADMDDEMADGPVDEAGRVVVQREASDDMMTVITDARVRAVTLVATPAFVEARIEADGMPADTAKTKKDEFEVTEDDRRPTAGMAEEAQRALNWRADGHAGGEDATVARARSIAARQPLSAETIRRMNAFFSRNARYPDLPGFAPGDDGYPSAARVAWGLWGGDAGRSWSGALVGRLAAETVTAAAAPRPPRSWFDDPGLAAPTALTVTEDGRVYGHLAVWGTCHTAYADACVTPPRSQSGYAFFHTGAVLTDDGEVPVGRVTIDTGHAGRRLSAASASHHYDHTGAAVADVRAGEDEHGIWVAGAVRPGVSDEQVAALRASPLSGDWRTVGGTLELVAALGVNSPGFPVARALVASGRTVTLQSAGALVLLSDATERLGERDLRLLRGMLDRERRAAAERSRRAAAVRRRLVAADAARRVGVR